ncbi:hypothetical protein [Megasphaera cerevisiae]|nr:hypothetical protein [Megasphaera cerevisiae]
MTYVYNHCTINVTKEVIVMSGLIGIIIAALVTFTIYMLYIKLTRH